MKAYFGGKSSIAQLVWERLGDVPNYVEPFLGSGAVLLARPAGHQWWERTETVNDLDALLANFWRALQADPEQVAHWADSPTNENEMHARHAWLVARKAGLRARIEGDPDYYDVKIAGWWVWGMSAWIGGGWCSGDGPWHVVDGELALDAPAVALQARELARSVGNGVERRRPHLGGGKGINRKRPHLSRSQGINRRMALAAGDGQCEAWSAHLLATMRRLADRLRRVRVCSGDWSRVCGPTPTIHNGLTGVFLDPPYAVGDRETVYNHDSRTVAHDVRQWAIANGDNPLLRIVLCGYQGEHQMPDGWTTVSWRANGGYSNQARGGRSENYQRECLWCSPHCLRPTQPSLFSMEDEADHER